MKTMRMNDQVGETAGKVWHELSNEGPQTLVQLQKKLKESNEFLLLSVGWLAREDKVEIGPGNGSLQILLK
jgi:hypothetical protein